MARLTCGLGMVLYTGGLRTWEAEAEELQGILGQAWATEKIVSQINKTTDSTKKRTQNLYLCYIVLS